MNLVLCGNFLNKLMFVCKYLCMLKKILFILDLGLSTKCDIKKYLFQNVGTPGKKLI